MKTFLELLQEDHAGKNLHLEHLEDEIINNGVAGGRGSQSTFYNHLEICYLVLHVHQST